MPHENENKLKQKNNEDIAFFLVGSVIIGMVVLGGLLPSYSHLVDIGFSGLLVYITFLYTHFTKKILDAGTKKREIDFIQRQLEYFYYPLLRIMEKAERKDKAFSEKVNSETDATTDAEYCACVEHNFWYNDLVGMLAVLKKNNIEELYKYKYLSSGNIREKFQKIEQYLERAVDDEFLEGDAKFLKDNQKQIYVGLKSFKEELESEIKEINNKLINLIN